MVSHPLVIGVIFIVVVAAAVWLSRRITAYRKEARLAAARGEFALRREWLEAHFLRIASSTGRPRGLSWVDVDFADEVSFARDLKRGELTALVAVAIRFEAIEGGGMEDVEAVGNEKAATAVFRYDGRQWTTNGRAIFNLNPVEAIEYYQGELEMVD
jgi:hypothetical protein